MDLTAKLSLDHIYAQLIANAQKVLERQPGNKQAADQVQACAAELASRGRGRAEDVAHLRWTADAVDDALKPFIEIARAVPGNGLLPIHGLGAHVGQARCGSIPTRRSRQAG